MYPQLFLEFSLVRDRASYFPVKKLIVAVGLGLVPVWGRLLTSHHDLKPFVLFYPDSLVLWSDQPLWSCRTNITVWWWWWWLRCQSICARTIPATSLFPPLSHPKPTSQFLDFSKPKPGQIIIHPKSWIVQGLCSLKAIFFPPVLSNVCWRGAPKGTQIKREESLGNLCCETGVISI